MRNLHHAANLHLSKDNDFWPELAPYKMMIPGAKNCYPPGVRQTEKPYVKLWRNVLFQAHLGEVSLQDYVFSGKAGIVMKNEMILSINLHYHDFLLQSWLSVKISLRIQWRASLCFEMIMTWQGYIATKG